MQGFIGEYVEDREKGDCQADDYEYEFAAAIDESIDCGHKNIISFSMQLEEIGEWSYI